MQHFADSTMPMPMVQGQSTTVNLFHHNRPALIMDNAPKNFIFFINFLLANINM